MGSVGVVEGWGCVRAWVAGLMRAEMDVWEDLVLDLISQIVVGCWVVVGHTLLVKTMQAGGQRRERRRVQQAGEQKVKKKKGVRAGLERARAIQLGIEEMRKGRGRGRCY